jgi:hypothetical protein
VSGNNKSEEASLVSTDKSFGPCTLYYRRSLGRIHPVKVANDMIGPFLSPSGSKENRPDIVKECKIAREHEDLTINELIVIYPLENIT